eukprot:m.173628 g.173628  ORF g.173628 m.173628 type:complete len:481 (-) comp17874_c0_seq2:36-1478(-)
MSAAEAEAPPSYDEEPVARGPTTTASGRSVATAVPAAEPPTPTAALGSGPAPENTSGATGATRQPRRRQRKAKAAPQLPSYERRNWLIHLAYVRQDFETCEKLVQAQLTESHGLCEFALYVQGLIVRQRGQIQQSLDLFQQAMHLNPNNIEYAKQVARSLFLMGRHLAALEVYEQTADLGLKDWHIFHNQGVCHSHLGNFGAAEKCFREALALYKHDNTYIQLSKALLKKGDQAAALQVLEDGFRFSPENTEIMTTLGLLHLDNGRTARAFELFGAALSYDPRDTKALLGAGFVIQSAEDYDVALIKYRVSAVHTPDSPELWNNIGLCFFGKGKHVAAIACLKRAMYFAPFEWMIPFNLGLVHLNTKQYASAFHYLSAAVNLKPDFPHSYMLLGVALSHLGDLHNAQAAFDKAIKLNSTDPSFYLNYAVILFNHDQRQQAAKQLSLYERCVGKLPDKTGLDARLQQRAEKLGAAIHLGVN